MDYQIAIVVANPRLKAPVLLIRPFVNQLVASLWLSQAMKIELMKVVGAGVIFPGDRLVITGVIETALIPSPGSI